MLKFFVFLLLLRNVVCQGGTSEDDNEWLCLQNEMGIESTDAIFNEGLTKEEIVERMIEDNPLPVPGEGYEWDGQYCVVSQNVSWSKPSQYLTCIIEFDSITGSRVLNTSYIEILNEENILETLFIGKIMISHLYMLDTLPYNCSLAPVIKITDIIYNSITNIIRIHITEPKLQEYMSEMDLNLTNKTLYNLNSIKSTVGQEILRHSLIENNITNASLTVSEFVCYELDSNGEVIGEAINDSLCESEDIILEMGSKYGNNGFIDPSEVDTVTNGRRRLLFGFIKKFVNKIVDFFVTVIDILKGDVDKRFSLAGLHVSERESFTLSGDFERETKNGQGTFSGSGEFTIEAAANLDFESYIDFEAKYKLFSINPSFDSMRIVIGTEIVANAFLNIDLKGELNFEYQIFEIGKRKVFFIGPLPVVIEVFSDLTAFLDLAFAMSLSMNAGIEPIIYEFGAKYTKESGWKTIAITSDIVPYYNIGSVLGEGEEEDDSCFTGNVIPAIELRVGVVFYEVLTIYSTFTFENDMLVTYPGTCSETAACALTNPQLSFDMSVEMAIGVGIVLGIHSLGLDLIELELEIASIPIFETSQCVDTFIAPLYYPCCGYPDVLFPTRTPTAKPTIQPSILTLYPTPAPTFPNGEFVPMTCKYLSRTGFNNEWTRGCSSGLSCNLFNGVKAAFHGWYEDRAFTWRSCHPSGEYVSNLFSHSFVNLPTTNYDSYFSRSCATDSSIVRIHSNHRNIRQDRIFNIKCAKYSNTKHKNCFDTTGYVNSFHTFFDFKCPNNGVMKGIRSTHSNSKEDRLFSFTCCKLVFDF